ncbi:MAG: DUF2244 domain-containing protein [Pseudomonadota bacterium]
MTFRAVLTPNRSLSPWGFILLMSVLCVVSFAIGIAFLLMGAWPVLGFFGLDILLIYWAFRWNYRTAREFETVEISPQSITVTRHSLDGVVDRIDFQTYWVRIFVDEEPSGRAHLRLRSHGNEIRLGQFLSDDERRSFAEILEAEVRSALRVA